MTTTTHKATCGCCGTGELTITMRSAEDWSSTPCPVCNLPVRRMDNELHAKLMAEHERAKESQA